MLFKSYRLLYFVVCTWFSLFLRKGHRGAQIASFPTQRRRFRSEFLLLSDLCLNYRLHLFSLVFLFFFFIFYFSSLSFLFLLLFFFPTVVVPFRTRRVRAPVVDTSCDVRFYRKIPFPSFSFLIPLNLCHLPLCTEIYFKLPFASLFLFLFFFFRFFFLLSSAPCMSCVR